MQYMTPRGAVLGALAGALALAAPLAPAPATIETPEAKAAAARAADEARADMRATFAKSSLKPGQYLWKDGRNQTEVTRVVIGLADQMAYAYDGDELIGVST